jgi:hypothetical protein
MRERKKERERERERGIEREREKLFLPSLLNLLNYGNRPPD